MPCNFLWAAFTAPLVVGEMRICKWGLSTISLNKLLVILPSFLNKLLDLLVSLPQTLLGLGFCGTTLLGGAGVISSDDSEGVGVAGPISVVDTNGYVLVLTDDDGRNSLVVPG